MSSEHAPSDSRQHQVARHIENASRTTARYTNSVSSQIGIFGRRSATPATDRRVYRQGLQPQTPALGSGLSAPRQVRGATDAKEYGGGCAATDRMSFSRHRRSIHPMWEQTGSRLGAHSRLSSVRMSRSRIFLGGVGLHHGPASASPAALRMRYSGPAVDEFAANGEQCLIRLSQPRGPPHTNYVWTTQCRHEFSGLLPLFLPYTFTLCLPPVRNHG
jgi:hypothetical protein